MPPYLPEEGHKKHEKRRSNFSCILWLHKEMPLEGVEPPLTCVNMDLNHARLPIPPQRLEFVIVAAQPAPRQAADNCPSFVDRCKNHGLRTTNETKKPPRPNCSAAAALEIGVIEACYCV